MQRVVFMGAPKFAVPVLEVLSRVYHVVGVVTQPDRRVGRGRHPAQGAVKRAALDLGLELYQPLCMATAQSVARLASWTPDVVVVAAIGFMLPQEVLDVPPHGCINVHASLLPRWRGAAPIAAAILNGDAVTGVTIMQMDAGLDTGAILAQREEPILADDTRATLSARLSRLGADLLIETLAAYLAGELVPRPQPEEGITYAETLRKADGLLDWSRPADDLGRCVRAYSPWPGTFTTWRGQRLKVLRATPAAGWQGDAPPGTVVTVADGVAVATGEGALRLEMVQLAGKRPVNGAAFVRGQRNFVGSQLMIDK
jgi:methionyl-tRNA formyltransferase